MMDGATPPISTEHQMARHLMGEFLRVHEAAPHVAVASADAFLDATSAQFPEASPFFTDGQAEVDWWVDCAPDSLVAAMLSACLKRLVRGHMLLAPNARKRALVAIWNTLPPADKTAFIDFIEPGPGAKG